MQQPWNEIFSTGRHTDMNGHTDVFTRDDLDEIVRGFEAVRGSYTVPLRLGRHATGLAPSVGGVAELRRNGDLLEMRHADMPAVVSEAITKRLYHSVSAGLVPGLEFAGKKFKWFLEHVAILGANVPAVKGLKDLTVLFQAPEGHEVRVYTVAEGDDSTPLTGEKEDDPMSEQLIRELTEKNARLEQAAAAKDLDLQEAEDKARQYQAGATEKDTELTTLRAEKEAADTALREFQATTLKAKVTDDIKAMVADGHLLPKFEAPAVEIGMALQGRNFTAGDGEKPLYSVLTDLLRNAKAVEFQEKAPFDGEPAHGEDADEKKANEMAQKYGKEVRKDS